MDGWTHQWWFTLVSAVGLQREILGILLLVPRVQGISWSIDICLYCLAGYQLYLVELKRKDPMMGPVYDEVSARLKQKQRWLSGVQVILYLEHHILW